jgi:CheY-like chemotaxis protein
MTETRENGRPHTILVVQSNEALRGASRELLEGFGHRVLVAADPEAALALACRPDDPIDLVVAEAFPRRGSGLELVRLLRRECPHLHALLLTAYGEDPALREAVEGREVLSLAVPFSTTDLRRAVATALGTSAPAVAAVQAAVAGATAARPAIPRWAWAAAATLLATAILWPAFDLGEPPPLPRGSGTETTRSLTILPVAPRGELERAPRTLRWEAVPGAVSYRVEVRGVDGGLLWEARTQAAEIEVDPSAVAFAPAVRYSWRVEAVDEHERPLASSPRVWVLVTPRPDSPQ